MSVNLIANTDLEAKQLINLYDADRPPLRSRFLAPLGLVAGFVDATGEPLMPCGRCRQLLWEHGGPNCLIEAKGGPLTMAQLLPHAFDVADIDAVVGEHPVPVVPDRLAAWRGRGSVFVHPDLDAGRQVWTAYWERSAGAEVEAETGVLEEGPTWPDPAEAIEWGLARTPRVVVVDAGGNFFWAGEGDPPMEIPVRWT